MREAPASTGAQSCLAASPAQIAFPMVNRGSFAFAAAPGRRYSARAIKLVDESLVIDMLGVRASSTSDPNSSTGR